LIIRWKLISGFGIKKIRKRMMKINNCIGIIRKKDGKLKYYWCKLQPWKYSPTRLDGAEGGALSYGAYERRYENK